MTLNVAERLRGPRKNQSSLMRTRETENFLLHRSVSKALSRSDSNDTGPCNNSLNQVSSHEFSNKSVWLGPSLRHT